MSGMNESFSNSGFLILSGTGVNDLSADPIQGFTPIGGAAVLAAITLPSQRAGSHYRGDATNLAGLSLLEGAFYPVPATALTLASGKLIGWRD